MIVIQFLVVTTGAYADTAPANYDELITWIDHSKIQSPQDFTKNLANSLKRTVILVAQSLAKKGQSTTDFPRMIFASYPEHFEDPLLLMVVDTNSQSSVYGEVHVLEIYDSKDYTKAPEFNFYRIQFPQFSQNKTATLIKTPREEPNPQYCMDCHSTSKGPIAQWNPYKVWENLMFSDDYKASPKNQLLMNVLNVFGDSQLSYFNELSELNIDRLDNALSYYISKKLVNHAFQQKADWTLFKKLIIGNAYLDSRCYYDNRRYILHAFSEVTSDHFDKENETLIELLRFGYEKKVQLLLAKYFQKDPTKKLPILNELNKKNTHTLFILEKLGIFKDPKELLAFSMLPDDSFFTNSGSTNFGLFTSGQDTHEEILGKYLIGLFSEDFREQLLKATPQKGYPKTALFIRELPLLWGISPIERSNPDLSKHCSQFAELFKLELRKINYDTVR